MKTKMFAWGACALCVMGLGGMTGCAATSPVPADKLARAQETVRIAETAPVTSTDPKTIEHQQIARKELEQGKKLILKGKNHDAKWALMRAQADGELAVYQAQAQQAKQEAQQTLDVITQAMSQMQMQGGH